MSVFKNIAAVRLAQAEVRASREAVAALAASLYAKGYEHPLTVVSAATGVGVVLGVLDVNPLRVPGLVSMLSGGATELATRAVMLAAGNFMGGGDGGNS
ncbi:hypothetical protein [Pinirhizobacter sp.]|jgi:hypothetical protein|uniref:hypothetical protein n=1 Tax=Pinirhizobacter sp. TaxID=2950432 RepID=UPI002F409A0E